MMVVFSILCFNFNILLPLLAKHDARRRPAHVRDHLGLLRRRRADRRAVAAAIASARWRVMFIGAAGFGLCELLLAPIHSTLVAGVLLFVCGIFFTSYTANSNARDPAREPGLHPRPRARPLLLRVERPGAARGDARRLAVRTGGTELAFSVAGVSGLAMAITGALVLRRPSRPPVAEPLHEPGEDLAAA